MQRPLRPGEIRELEQEAFKTEEELFWEHYGNNKIPPHPISAETIQGFRTMEQSLDSLWGGNPRLGKLAAKLSKKPRLNSKGGEWKPRAKEVNGILYSRDGNQDPEDDSLN